MQMLFIIPLLKTENPYYIIVNILIDNGENTMQNEKTSVLVLAQCDLTMRETLNTRFGMQCTFTFAENGEHPTAEQLRAAAVIFGEPSEAQLAQTENLRLLQLTWAGADKYTRMENLPQSAVLANASGAFGTIIAEYAIGSLVALYRSFGRYWSNKQAHIWQKYDHAETISGKTALVLGMGDIGANVARRLKVFGAAVLGVKRTAVSAVPADFDEAHTLDALDALLPRADIVIGCLPNTRETAGRAFARDESRRGAGQCRTRQSGGDGRSGVGFAGRPPRRRRTRCVRDRTASGGLSAVGHGERAAHAAYRRPELRRQRGRAEHDLAYLHGQSGAVFDRKPAEKCRKPVGGILIRVSRRYSNKEKTSRKPCCRLVFWCSAVFEKPDDKVDNLYAEENQGNHADDSRCRHKLDGRFAQAFNNHAGQRNKQADHARRMQRMLQDPLADLTGFVGFRCRLGCFLLCGDRPAAAGPIRCIARRFLHALPVVHIAVKSLAVEAVIVVFHMPCLPFML